MLPTFLVDGFVAGTWSVEESAGRATLALFPFTDLQRKDKDAVAAEALDLCKWLHPGAQSHAARLGDTSPGS